MLLIRLVLLPVRLAFATTGMTLRTGYRAGRLVGYKRMTVFTLGVAVGLLVAPGPGRDLRERLRRAAGGQGGPAGDDELGERVRFELSHSPRTWHLPQPEVEATAGRVTLSGEVPNETGRQDLERAAAAVRGVLGVDNRVRVTGTGRGSEAGTQAAS